jgi:hypothetical protein
LRKPGIYASARSTTRWLRLIVDQKRQLAFADKDRVRPWFDGGSSVAAAFNVKQNVVVLQ